MHVVWAFFIFFHLMSISILGISDAVNGFVTTSPLILFNFLPFIYLKSAGHYDIPSVQNLRLVSVRLSVRHHFASAL